MMMSSRVKKPIPIRSERYATDKLFTRHPLWYYRPRMEFIRSIVLPILPYVQIAISVLLIAVILLQQRGSSLGGAFGGDNFSAAFHKRRGGELVLFRAAIILALLFVLSTILAIAA